MSTALPVSPDTQISLSAADILARITDAVFAVDRDWCFTYANAQAEVLLQCNRAELLGRNIWHAFPEALGTASEREYRRAMTEQVATTFEQFYPPLDTWFEARVYPSSEGISVYFRDITEQQRTESALRASEEALRASEERLQDAQVRLAATLSAGGIATWTWDVANDRVVADANMARLFSVSSEDAAGGQIDVYLRAIHPEDRSRVVEAIGNAVAHQDTYEAEYRVVLPDGSYRWLATRGRVERDADGRAIALPGVVQDITEQAERGRRERFLADLADRARRTIDPDEVIADAVRSVGQFLGVSRCVFADIDIEADTCTIPPDYRADASVVSMAGTFPISTFGPYLVAAYGAGRTVVVDDVRQDPTQVPTDYLPAYEAIACRAFIAVPVLHSARLVSVIAVHAMTPRNWKPEEVELLQTVVERTWFTIEVTRQQRSLVREAEERREAHERTESILESITDAFYALDAQFRFSYINRQAEAMWGRSREEFLGKNLVEVFPASVGSISLSQHERALAERVPIHFEAISPVLGRWLDVSIYPTADGGLSVFFRDISERIERERRERFLADLADRARVLTDPDEVIADTVRSLGEFLGISRCAFANIDPEADTCTIPFDYCADETVASMAGTFPISVFGDFLIASFQAGQTITVDDVRADPKQVAPQNVATYEASNILAFIAAPVVHSTRLVSCLACHNAMPRQWKPEEVELVQTVVERTWLTVEVLRQQRALVREAEERRDAHERTGRILESIGDAFYAIDREWRFSYLNAQAERLLFRPREELLGRGIWEAFPDAIGGTFYEVYHRAMSENVVVSIEDYYAPLEAWMDVRVYPSSDGLSVFFQNVNERKALEAERERLAERERNIASQLQEALLPDLPGTVPGLALTKYYRPALAQTEGVGGDFYDVFALEKGRTALVVGDLSGKGLAAAAQVATVRNMLRAFLYSQPTVAEAVMELNRVLAENNLLTGFTTLFVGAYDSAVGQLKYVNCGQEPALVRRSSTGMVETLPPTGPILGTIEGARYTEAAAMLAPGDAVAIFTDGLTEVGPRTEMFGIDGITDLLGKAVLGSSTAGANQVAEALTQHLISGVDNFSSTGAHDDMCLLVGVVH